MAPALKVKLIQPSRYVDSGEVLKLRRMLFPSLRLPLLAALAPDDVEVVAQSEYFEPIDFDEPVDLVGITSATIQASRAYEIADEFRRRKVPVVMGGIHASMMPDEAAEHADTVIVGEADDTWPAFLDDFKAGRAKPRYVMERPPDLVGLPVPRFSIMNPAHYCVMARRGIYRLLPSPLLPVQTARGCPHGCEFCSVTAFNGRRLRARPIGEVVEEVRALGLRGCFFTDDNIFADPARAKELFRALIPLRIVWMSQGTIKAARDPELIRLACESGCRVLVVGIESISNETLEAVGKTHNIVDDYARHIATFLDAGISIFATMMFGFDGEPLSVFDDTCDFLIRNRVTYTSWQALTPYPGTRTYESLREQGRLKEDRWWLRRGTPDGRPRLKYRANGLDEAAFFDGFRRAYARFYSVGGIARRILLPPQKRWVYKTFFNLRAARRVSHQTGIVET